MKKQEKENRFTARREYAQMYFIRKESGEIYSEEI